MLGTALITKSDGATKEYHYIICDYCGISAGDLKDAVSIPSGWASTVSWDLAVHLCPDCAARPPDERT